MSGLRHNYDSLRKKLRPEVTETRHEHDSVVAFADTIFGGYDIVVVYETTTGYDNWAASLIFFPVFLLKVANINFRKSQVE